MGTPAFAAESLSAILDAGHDVAAVVTRPDARAGRGRRLQPPPVKVVGFARGVPVLQPAEVASQAFLDMMAALRPDILVVVAFGRILGQPLLDLAPGGAINVHASLLPKLRGASPIVWAIARGESETGVTTMKMVRQLDAGAILLQRATPIGPEETAGALEGRLARLGAGLLVETLADLAAGRVEEQPQDERLVTWAPMLKKSDGLVDWSLGAAQIARHVRAFDPWPGAWTTLSGAALRIWKARDAGETKVADPAGRIVSARGGADGREAVVLVACGGGTALQVSELQPEGRRRMTAAQALSGRYLKEGDQLGGG